MISFISVATLFTPPITSSIVVPAVATSWLPVAISATESSMSFLISRAEVAERCARLRTSDATTATAPLFTGARGFHRGIERQNISLESDTVDHADDIDNL